NLCASGVFERFPKLKFATIEAGIGWLPGVLDAMGEAYRKHHFWVRPKLKHMPSDYYRTHGFASFQEDAVGLALAERCNLVDNFLWGNDYPHHEGTWPHSAEAIERTMGGLRDDARAKVRGLNAAALFSSRVPEGCGRGAAGACHDGAAADHARDRSGGRGGERARRAPARGIGPEDLRRGQGRRLRPRRRGDGRGVSGERRGCTG